MEWVLFIGYNRNKIEKTEDNKKINNRMKSLLNSGYDYIVGDIADDRMSQNMESFFSNQITYGQLLLCLTQLKVGKQYCLKTQKAVDRLKCTGIYKLDDALRYLIKEYAMEKREEAVNASDTIVSRPDLDGLKFRDLLKKYGK